MHFVFQWSDLLVMDLHRQHAPSSVQAALYSIQTTCITGQLQSCHCRRAFPFKSHVLSLAPMWQQPPYERRTTSNLLFERPECLTMRLTPHNARNVLPSSNMSAITPPGTCTSMVDDGSEFLALCGVSRMVKHSGFSERRVEVVRRSYVG